MLTQMLKEDALFHLKWPTSESINQRNQDIFRIFDVCKKLKLEKLTIHIATSIYDILDKKHQNNLRLKKLKTKDLLLLVIILISAKFNERDEILISTFELQKEMGTRFTSRNLYASGKLIMNLLNWNISLLTICIMYNFLFNRSSI